MKTLEVMCIVLTRTMPSCTPDSRMASATSGVMLTKAILPGMLSVRYLVWDFIDFGEWCAYHSPLTYSPLTNHSPNHHSLIHIRIRAEVFHDLLALAFVVHEVEALAVVAFFDAGL